MSTNPDFPFEWENPDDARLYWTRDGVHQPKPSLPLRHSFGAEIIGAGSERASQVCPTPGRYRSIVVNGYDFETHIPDPPEVTEQKMQRREHVLLERLADLPRRWREEFEPELARDLAGWQAFDLQRAGWDALGAHFEHRLSRMLRHWEIHFLTVSPVFHSTRVLSQMYERLTGDRDEQAPYMLVAGFPSKTSERDLALWRVAELARQSPGVVEAFLTRAPAEVLPGLRALSDPAARQFIRALDDYLARYGDRGEGSIEHPTWREDPTFVLTVLKAYLAGARRDPEAELAAVAAEREQFVAETLARIPEGERAAFEQALRQAQAVAPLRETHAFFIDQASVSYFRYAVVELGRRLAGMGVLARPEDVFYLQLDELRALLHGPAPAGLRALVEQRRADHARWSRLHAPAAIGTMPETPLPVDSEDGKFLRPISTDIPAGPIRELKGAAGARGQARGPAVVVLSESEFARVRPGDVLVCATTFPPWTPLFRVVAGLVTDAGGVLSHGAIVAREYRLPAVVGTGYATRVIRDGQMLEVDGTKGVVRIVED